MISGMGKLFLVWLLLMLRDHPECPPECWGGWYIWGLDGVMRILSGHFKRTLAVSQSKGEIEILSLITNAIFAPLYERILGLDKINSAAPQTRRYRSIYGISEEECAKVSVKNHRNAKKILTPSPPSRSRFKMFWILNCCPILLNNPRLQGEGFGFWSAGSR